MMKRILVTGGAGFIGTNLVQALMAEHRYEVFNLDKLTYAGNLEGLRCLDAQSQYHFCHGDIADPALVRRILLDFKPDWVFNLAAESHVDRSIDTPSIFVTTNIVGAHVLVDACLQYWRELPIAKQQAFRFIQISTDEVYGSLTSCGRFNEQSAYQPRSPYAATKAGADLVLNAYYHTYGFPLIISHCSNNYGPYQLPEKLIPLCILNALEGQSLPIYGDGQNVRDWIHVSDHVQGLLTLAQHAQPGQHYCVGAQTELSNLQLVEQLCACLDELKPAAAPYRELISFVKDRPGHDRRYAIDPAKIQSELGWRPDIPFRQGLRDTVQWYLNADKWLEAVNQPQLRARQGNLDQVPH